MKTIKTIVTVLILILSVQTTFAQQKNKKAMHIDKMVTYVTEKVSLTPDEATGVKDILTNFSKSKKEIKVDTSLSSKEKKTKNKEMYSQRNKELNKLLGKEKGIAVRNAIKEFQQMNNNE